MKAVKSLLVLPDLTFFKGMPGVILQTAVMVDQHSNFSVPLRKELAQETIYAKDEMKRPGTADA